MRCNWWRWRTCSKGWLAISFVLSLAVTLWPNRAAAATITVDGAVCTLPDAIVAANTDLAIGSCAAGNGADTLVLTADSYALDTAPFDHDGITATPSITSTIVISGGVDGTTVIRSDPTPYRLFHVSAGGDLTVEHVVLRNGYLIAYDKGGAIYNRGTLTLRDSQIISNTAHQGGGVYNDHATATVANSDFAANLATGAGGAIYSHVSTVTLTDSDFHTNRTTSEQGGAIFSAHGPLTVTNCMFTSNTAGRGGWGGAIFGRNVTLTLANSHIRDNRAREGGGIYTEDSTLTLDNMSIISNTADQGGGIQIVGSAVTLQQTEILSNTAQRGGGAYIWYSETGTIVDTTFAYNVATTEGGGLLIDYNDYVELFYKIIGFSITNTNFISNMAAVGGGIMVGGRGWLTVTHSTISGNRAHADGGGILNRPPSTLKIIESEIAANFAGASGGGVYGQSILHMTDSDVVANVAGARGGGLYQYAANAATGWFNADARFTVDRTRFLHNRAAEGGAAIFQSGGFGQIAHSCIVGNRPNAVWNLYHPLLDAADNWWGTADGPSGTGGGHGDRLGENITYAPYLDSRIMECPAGEPDSRLYLTRVAAYETAHEIVVNTTAPFNGDETNGDCTLGEAILAANTNLRHDGCAAGSSGTDTIVLAPGAVYPLFTSYHDVNSGDDYLGATGLPYIVSTIIIKGSGATIVRSGDERFRLLSVARAGNLTLEGLTLRNGDAAGGGAIFNAGTLQLVNSHIVANTAALGGAIFNAEFGKTTMTNSIVADNTSSEGGGFYNMEYGVLVVADSHIVSNTATDGGNPDAWRIGNGGGIYNWRIGSVFVYDSEFAANHATDFGGGILNKGALVMRDVDVVGNSAGLTGGGLYQRGWTDPGYNGVASFQLTGVQFLNNVAAEDGGAIRLLDGTATIQQSCIVGNSDTGVSHLYYPGNAPIDAMNNWWGAADGPGGVAPGAGDSVSADVIYIPYWIEPILTCSPRR